MLATFEAHVVCRPGIVSTTCGPWSRLSFLTTLSSHFDAVNFFNGVVVRFPIFFRDKLTTTDNTCTTFIILKRNVHFREAFMQR